MTRVKLLTAESESVERAFYEAYSYEAIVSILSRELRDAGNHETAEVLKYYSELCRAAHMKLKMAQDMVLSKYGLDAPGSHYRFDFSREEVWTDDPEA